MQKIDELHSDVSGLDLNFRPETYWGIPESMLANIKGNKRRKLVKDALNKGETIPDYVFEPSWPIERRENRMRKHPGLAGGEYLPDYITGEVEIARIVMPYTTLCDVTSVRVRWRKGKFIYRCIDEYWDDGFRYYTNPKTSKYPLSLAGVINLVLDIQCGEFRYGDPFIYSLFYQWYCEDGCDYDQPLEIESEFYPQLFPYFYALQESFFRTVSADDEEELTAEEHYDRALKGFNLPRVRSNVELKQKGCR